ncbi:MAG TPA: hypothetical protein VMW10_00670 [Alphaproteobacteria bacterium]|nr:hypothetical protein [Alphaproteobacteria bacterium]
MSKFASTSILIGLFLCSPLNDGKCVAISNEEMDAPLGGIIQQGRGKGAVSSQARMISQSIEEKYKKRLWARALETIFEHEITLSEEDKETIAMAKESAKETTQKFLQENQETPFEALRVVKHLFNTYTEIEDLADYLLGDKSVNISGMYPSDENSTFENRRFFLFPLPHDFERYNEWTPTQNIWNWAKERQKNARTNKKVTLGNYDDVPHLEEY